MQSIANHIKILLYESKGTQKLQYEMRKLKGGMRENKLLWHEDLSRGSVSHKGTPTSTLLKHSLRVLLLGNQVSSVDKITVTLIPISTKELLHKGWGSPRPPHKVVHTAPHQVGGLLTLPASLKAPRGRRTEIFLWFTLEPAHKV